MEHALDYRHHYGHPHHNPYARNPLTVGQWLMIGAGALAAGGIGYWVYAKVKTSGANGAVNGNGNGNGNGNANNPMYRAA